MNNILIIALAYPSKDNPYAGSFYKDQVDLIGKQYNCTVVVFKEQKKGIFHSYKSVVTEAEYTKGIIQYYPIVYISLFRLFLEGFLAFIRKKRSNAPAIGIFRSEYYRMYRKKRIKELVKLYDLKYDLVYCLSAQESAFYAYQFAEINNKPLIIGEHRPFPHPGWATVETEWEALNKAECFFAISKDKIRQVMLQDIHPKRIAYVGNFVDEKKFYPAPTTHKYKTLLIIAAHSYFKNYDMFIETVEKLRAKTINEFRIIIAGYGANKGYAKNVNVLEAKINASSFVNITEVIPEVKRDELCPLYNRADAFVLTSVQEGQPMVCLEAAACGLPIFSTKCGGVEDYVTDEIGRIVDITDSDMLSDYLKQFIDGEITFDANIIRNKIVGLYGSEAYMNNVKREFDRLINGNGNL